METIWQQWNRNCVIAVYTLAIGSPHKKLSLCSSSCLLIASHKYLPKQLGQVVACHNDCHLKTVKIYSQSFWSLLRTNSLFSQLKWVILMIINANAFFFLLQTAQIVFVHAYAMGFKIKLWHGKLTVQSINQSITLYLYITKSQLKTCNIVTVG